VRQPGTRITLLLLAALAGAPPALADEPSWFDKAGDRLADTWRNGASDLYLPFHTHHMRSTYNSSQIDGYQEKPYGLGYGRSKFDGDGDWNGVYAMGFQDSHYKPSYVAGYTFLKIWRPAADWRIGGGFTAFVMTRSDVAHYIPFPGVLPVGSIGYRNVSVEVSYVPGGGGAGNVLFFWGRMRFE
jgi:hypothetical protein